MVYGRMTERGVLKAVARADMTLCAEWQWIVAAVVVFIVAVLAILIAGWR